MNVIVLVACGNNQAYYRGRPASDFQLFPSFVTSFTFPSLGVKVQSNALYSIKNNFPLIRLAGG